MPTADQRLDQLEPVISELLARQDETAAKVERVSAQVRQLTIVTTTALTTQSDNIQFLLGKTAQIDQRLDVIDQRLGSMDQRLDVIDQRLGSMDQRLNNMDQRFDKIDQRFDEMGQQLGRLGQQFSQITDFIKDKLK